MADLSRRTERFRRFDTARVPSPCFVVDRLAIEENLRVLDQVQRASGARILLALKAFAMWKLAPLVARYLHGTCASGLDEARLGREEFGESAPCYAETAGRVLTVGNDEVDSVLGTKDRQQVRNCPPSRASDDVADYEYSHA